MCIHYHGTWNIIMKPWRMFELYVYNSAVSPGKSYHKNKVFSRRRIVHTVHLFLTFMMGLNSRCAWSAISSALLPTIRKPMNEVCSCASLFNTVLALFIMVISSLIAAKDYANCWRSPPSTNEASSGTSCVKFVLHTIYILSTPRYLASCMEWDDNFAVNIIKNITAC